MQLSSFDEVLLLDQDALRRLLGNGPNIQRVWAAWALGLRLGQAFTAEVGTRVDREPDPGVRRHLSVILASAGDRAAIDVLAENDPCEYVRASTLRLMLQIAPPGTQSTVVSRLLEVARTEPSPHVRSEALRLLSPADHHLPVEPIAACLGDPAVSVRAAAADLLLELPFDDRVAELLASAATTETDTDELERLWQRVARLERAERQRGLGSPSPAVVREARFVSSATSHFVPFRISAIAGAPPFQRIPGRPSRSGGWWASSRRSWRTFAAFHRQTMTGGLTTTGWSWKSRNSRRSDGACSVSSERAPE